ncbi:MAG: hypothetical protein R3194_10450 [Limnobacter sp.]|nr:hypothetical protein [Limnobacter sp.]
MSSNNAAPLARLALEQNFGCFAQTGVVLGLNVDASAHPMTVSQVSFSAQAKCTLATKEEDSFNKHLIESFAHSSQLIWLRTLIPSETSLRLGHLNHPNHLQTILPKFNRHRWLNLLNAYALAHPVSNTNALLRNGQIEVDGTQVRMQYTESHPDHIVLKVEAGAIPASLTSQQLRMLTMTMLQANHRYSMPSGLVWSINPDNNYATLAVECCVFSADRRPIDEKELHQLIIQHVQLTQSTWMNVLEGVLRRPQIGVADLANNALPERLPLSRPNCPEIH